MCRNYDGGECVEPDCTGRITCHDFMDKRCAEHSINGRGGLPFVDDDTPAPEQDRPDAADLWRAINGALLASPVHINREDAALATRWVVDVIAPFVVTRSQTDKRPHPDSMGTSAPEAPDGS